MRLFKILLLILFFSCSNFKYNLYSKQNGIELHYTFNSKNNYTKIIITKEKVLNKYNKVVTSNITTTDYWQTCILLLSKIELKKLTNIKAPSSKRYFDGAPHAILSIKIAGEEINTPFFDHGFPPKEIAALINHILLSL